MTYKVELCTYAERCEQIVTLIDDARPDETIAELICSAEMELTFEQHSATTPGRVIEHFVDVAVYLTTGRSEDLVV